MLRSFLRSLLKGRAAEVDAPPDATLPPAPAAVAAPPPAAPAPDAPKSFSSTVFWGVTDPRRVYDAAMDIGANVEKGCHFADNFLTWGRNLSMLDDPPFLRSWEANAEGPADRAIMWRRYVLAIAAHHCVQLEGDFVECGAYTGVGIKTVMDYLGGPAFPKAFWGYDLFEHDPSMLHPAMPEHGSGLYERVRAKFAGYPQARIVKGLIPDVFAQACPERVAYLHIDLNHADAEIAALEHLFHRMVPGGILVLDDYEWAGSYRAQKLAEDPWFEARGYRVMPLPTGQGLVIRR